MYNWMDDAACRNHPEPEIFFADESERPAGVSYDKHYAERNRQTIRAKRVCERCPVQLECRETAVNSETKVWGVWGGMTERDRHRLQRRVSARRTSQHRDR